MPRLACYWRLRGVSSDSLAYSVAGLLIAVRPGILHPVCGFSGPRRPLFLVTAGGAALLVAAAFPADTLSAMRLAGTPASAKSGIVAEIANRLRAFGAEPLRVAKLRGGMVYEGFWCEDPRQPTLVTTTVDQLGSRLLFRGYGCSDTRRPIEAGLVGNDSLVLVDEAHLSDESGIEG